MNTKRFEKYYVIIPLILSLTLSTLPVIFGALGFDEKEISCWYKHGNTTSSVIWQWATLHGWVVLSVTYCIISVSLIIYRLYTVNDKVYDTRSSTCVSTPQPNKNKRNNHNRRSSYTSKTRINQLLLINRAVKRIVVYPIIPIICFVFNITATLVFYFKQENYFPIQIASNVGTSSQGFLNALVFCFDPVMRHIWIELAKKWIKVDSADKKVDKEGNDDENTKFDEMDTKDNFAFDKIRFNFTNRNDSSNNDDDDIDEEEMRYSRDVVTLL